MPDSERPTGEVVREAIERDGSIKIGLARGLINARALARYIQAATHDQYAFEALLSAIRRYPIKEGAESRVKLGKLIRKLSMKNKISVIVLRNHPELQLILARFAGEIDHAGGETLRVVSTPNMVNVEIDSKNERKLASKLGKQDLLHKRSNLAEVDVEFLEMEDVPGLLSAMSTELAMNGINIVEFYSAGPRTVRGEQQETDVISELFFVVEENDAPKTYEVLERLSKEK
jgi:hypothetical protein